MSDGQNATPGKGIQRAVPDALNLEMAREWRLRSNSDLTMRTQRTPGVVPALPTPSLMPAVVPDLPKPPITPGRVRPSATLKEILPSTPGSQNVVGSPGPRPVQSPGSIGGGLPSLGKVVSSADYFSLPSSSLAD